MNQGFYRPQRNWQNQPRQNWSMQNNQNWNNQPQKKHSGAKYISSAKNGAECITAWNFSRGAGLISIIASPHKKKAKTKSKQGCECWMVKVTNKRFRTEVWEMGWYNPNNGKLTIQSMQMVANPRANNGGYFGKYFK